MEQPTEVVCLLPARNAAADLPGYLASAARVCDAIVALDDGSTDATGEILAEHPLVKIVLRNPRRPDYRDWDDAANRNRLLAAAAALHPAWILSLDADERIDPSDAAALRAFLATDALPGCAYGFRHVPMRGDTDHFLPRYQWVYRLFAFEPTHRFPNQRLHFVPIPTAIPRARWLRTTLRIQHLGGLTADRRLVRFAKYLEADPDRTYQADYAHLLDDPAHGALRRWEPRPPGLPLLVAGAASSAPAAAPPSAGPDDGPTLSAIVIARNDAATIARSVASVVGQVCPEPFEVIVVTSGTDRTAAIVREEFPTVTLVALERPALPGEARNAGLRLARGTYVTFPGSHIELPPGSLAARLVAHRRGYAMVTGVTHNGNLTRAGWASYFLDHHGNLPGHRPAELKGAPAYCSYARLPLLEVGGFPDGVRTAEDTAANRALVRRGYVAYRDPAVVMVHRSPCRTPWRLVRHHFVRGRGWGRLLLEDRRARGHLFERNFVTTRLVRYVPRRLERIRRNVALADPNLAAPYRAARPLIVLGSLAAWAGMWWEVVRPAPGKLEILIGRPVRTLALVATGTGHTAIVVLRLDLVAGQLQAIVLPPDLPVADPVGAAQRLDAALLAAVTDAPHARDTRIRAVVATAARLEIDDYLAGPAPELARFVGPLADGDLASTPPHVHGSSGWARVRAVVASGLHLLRAGIATRSGAVQTSLRPRELAAVAAVVRRGPAVAVTTFAHAADRPVVAPPRPARRGAASARRRGAAAEPDDAPRPWMP